MNDAASAPYNGANMVLPPSGQLYTSTGMNTLVAAPDTSTWYRTNYGCLITDPTRIARLHSFPDAPIPDGVPSTPAPPAKICLNYRTAWPQEVVDAAGMVETEREHPQFAFSPGGPATPYQIDVESQLRLLDQPLSKCQSVLSMDDAPLFASIPGGPGKPYQIDVESQLRRLDQPLGKCQAVLPMDAPLFRNTVAPPPPVNVPPAVQNAANPVAAILVKGDREDCRVAADSVASAMSGRWVNNPTRQDTMRFEKPFNPPGTGTGAARGPVGGSPYYS